MKEKKSILYVLSLRISFIPPHALLVADRDGDAFVLVTVVVVVVVVVEAVEFLVF